MRIEDLDLYLPKYLSDLAEKSLLESLKSFPSNMDQRFYTDYLKNEPAIFQGDGLKNLLVVELPSTDIKKVKGIVLSNTCDIDPTNKRNYPSQIVYAPIINYDSYKNNLIRRMSGAEAKLSNHFQAIEEQSVTQIFYLPPCKNVIEASIVFLDRVMNINVKHFNTENINNSKIFTLSDYGAYLFVYKLSIHFTRIKDKVERKSFV